jgi:Na+-transporting NADH:ubiquinone oxidoreductase subunit C
VSNKNSSGYILTYTLVLTLFCGIALFLISTSLKPFQDKNIELDKKKKILSTFTKMDENWDAAKIEAEYSKRVKGFVINYKGEKIEGVEATSINIESENKKKVEDRQYQVFEVASEKDPSKIEFYVFSASGKGLWDKISSYFALKSDMNTIQGVVFDHKAETPGLGARIKDDEVVYNRYAGKTIFEGDQLTPVVMMKNEGNDYSDKPHAVDGMSGATKTAVGVNDMFAEYLKGYENYIKANKK